ncbi:MAG: GNAT family N-acetyltransferase [Phycisphaerales bacterium]|nr:GNAT family N-acetyltransferase [Phycisphaerales bacterium]
MSLSTHNLRMRAESRPSDGAAVREIVASSGFFHAFEIDVALELVEDRLARGAASDYRFIFADLGGRRADVDREGANAHGGGADADDGRADEDCKPVGYACYGPIACTLGSFDLYWIAVHELYRGGGLGRRLMSEVETRIAGEGGRKVYIETSSRPQYEPTRRFYERCGYVVEAVLPDFYAAGDGKVILAKSLTTPDRSG